LPQACAHKAFDALPVLNASAALWTLEALVPAAPVPTRIPVATTIVRDACIEIAVPGEATTATTQCFNTLQ
jgi:hypothetical protein